MEHFVTKCAVTIRREAKTVVMNEKSVQKLLPERQPRFKGTLL